MTAKPFFILSSGCSGGSILAHALTGIEDVTVERDYMAPIVRPLGVRRYQGLARVEETRSILAAHHGAAVRYAETAQWGDCSDALGWLVPDLASLFPEARFIHLVRDGRDVVSANYNNNNHDCYDDAATRVTAAHLATPYTVPAPPPESKYWWPQAKKSDEWAPAFPRFDRFQRICWHWAESNRAIARDLSVIPSERRLFLRLEDLRAQPLAVARLFKFLGLPYRGQYFAMFMRADNAVQRLEPHLSPLQTAQFSRIASPTMERLGYVAPQTYAVTA
jgi:hypothetical protein